MYEAEVPRTVPVQLVPFVDVDAGVVWEAELPRGVPVQLVP